MVSARFFQSRGMGDQPCDVLERKGVLNALKAMY